MTLLVLAPWILSAALLAKGLTGGGAPFLLLGGAAAIAALVLSVLALTLALVRRGPRGHVPLISDRR